MGEWEFEPVCLCWKYQDVPVELQGSSIILGILLFEHFFLQHILRKLILADLIIALVQ